MPSQQPPRKSPKLPARRADVTAAGRARPPRLCPASPLAASPSAEIRLQPFFFCVCRVRNAPARRRNVRFSGFRWVRARLSRESRTNRRHGRDSVEAAYYPALFSEAESACTAISSSSCAICSSGRRIRLSSGFSFDSRFMLPYQTRQRSRIAKCSRQVWDGKTSIQTGARSRFSQRPDMYPVRRVQA